MSRSNMTTYAKVADVVKSSQIYFDPSDRSSFIEEDRLSLEQLYTLQDLMNEVSNETATRQDDDYSKLVTRLELSAEVMLNKSIAMDDIHFAIENSAYGNKIHCVFSDYNSDKLIFRIRIKLAFSLPSHPTWSVVAK